MPDAGDQLQNNHQDEGGYTGRDALQGVQAIKLGKGWKKVAISD